MLSSQQGKNKYFPPNVPLDSFSEFHQDNQHSVNEDDQMREGILINFSIFCDEKPQPKESFKSIPTKQNETVKPQVKTEIKPSLVINLPVIKKEVKKEKLRELKVKAQSYVEEVKVATSKEVPQALNTKVTIPLIQNVCHEPVTVPNLPPPPNEEKLKQIIQQSSSGLKLVNKEKKYANFCSTFLSKVRLR